MKTKKQKILILSDINKSIDKTITSSIGLAKIIDADIHFFYVKKPSEVIEKESQLSAMRVINKEYFTIDKKIKDIINPISKKYDTPINYSYTIGNLKDEIDTFIDKNKPDIIVLGKRKSKFVNFIGDNITPFILKKHKGVIVIANDNNVLEPNKELSLGLFNDTKSIDTLTENIINSTQKQLKSFKIIEKSMTLEKEDFLSDKKTVDFIFEKGDHVIKNISNYLSKNKINLLFVNREKNNQNVISPNINDLINTVDCSLMITN